MRLQSGQCSVLERQHALSKCSVSVLEYRKALDNLGVGIATDSEQLFNLSSWLSCCMSASCGQVLNLSRNHSPNTIVPGVLCKVDIDECESNPCDTTKTKECIHTIDYYECICKPGYEGIDCSVSTHVMNQLL